MAIHRITIFGLKVVHQQSPPVLVMTLSMAHLMLKPCPAVPVMMLSSRIWALMWFMVMPAMTALSWWRQTPAHKFMVMPAMTPLCLKTTKP